MMQATHSIRAGVLEVAYHEAGPADGPPVVLMHGFPYDIHAYAEVAPLLSARGCRVIVPYMRGYGGTRFLDAATPRSGEQAAFGADLLALLDALAIPRAVLAGYDWGGRACCVVAALWPQRCAGLVSLNSYNIQNIARAMVPDTPENERSLWYQYYFHSERGRAGLEKDRRGIAFARGSASDRTPNGRPSGHRDGRPGFRGRFEGRHDAGGRARVQARTYQGIWRAGGSV